MFKISSKTIIAIVAILIIAIIGAAASPARAAMQTPGTVYAPHTALAVRAAPSLDAAPLATLTASVEYPVAEYNWTPATAQNAWACIEYEQGKPCGYAPVQIGYIIYASVKFNLGVIYPLGW